MEIKPLSDRVGKCGVAIFGLLQGRATTFAVYFTIVGTILQFQGKLTGTYIALITAIQGLIVLHSTKEDYFDNKRGDRNSQ